MYETYIVDELGAIMENASYYSDDEINEILAEHPEWKVKAVKVY